MYKEILKAQLDDRVKRGLATVIEMYGRFDELTDEEFEGIYEITEGIACIFKALREINNGDAEKYKPLVYTLAHGEEE